jgi:hypothetical protein
MSFAIAHLGFKIHPFFWFSFGSLFCLSSNHSIHCPAFHIGLMAIRVCVSLFTLVSRPLQSIRSVAIVDPTGSKPTIVGGADSGALHFVDVHSRTETRRIASAHRSPIAAVAYRCHGQSFGVSGGGGLLATCGADQMIRLWDSADARCVWGVFGFGRKEIHCLPTFSRCLRATADANVKSVASYCFHCCTVRFGGTLVSRAFFFSRDFLDNIFLFFMHHVYFLLCPSTTPTRQVCGHHCRRRAALVPRL